MLALESLPPSLAMLTPSHARVAFATALLAWGMLAFPKGFSQNGDNTAAALANVQWGADYLMKTFRPGNLNGSLPTAGYTIVYQVCCAAAQGHDSSVVKGCHALHAPSWSAQLHAACQLNASLCIISARRMEATAACRLSRTARLYVPLHPLTPCCWQVGNLTLDHDFWGPPEYMTAANMPRPAYVVETSSGASDLAGSMAGALAASSMAVRKFGSDPSAADGYLTAAANLYNAVRPSLYE